VGLLTELSMTIPLVPKIASAVADVALVVPNPGALVTSNDIMQPLPFGQDIGAAVLLEDSTLRKIRSVELLNNSVTGEQVVLAPEAVSAGPFVAVPSALLVMGTWYKVGTPLLSPHTYRLPLGLAELEVK
jgi:hypothetical protein